MADQARGIRVSANQGVRTITLDRPPVNVLDIGMIREMTAAIEEAGKDPSTRVIVFRAAGKAFCAGVEVGDHKPDKAPDMIGTFGRFFDAIVEAAVPTIAVVEGAALGGGAEVALFCDLVLAGPKARFGVPEIQLGFFPPIAAAVFPRRVPRAVAMEMMLTGDPVDAKRAWETGLVNALLPETGSEEAIAAFVGRVARHSGAVLRLAVRAADQADGMPMGPAIRHANTIFLSQLMGTEDVREGIASFFEKRKPAWKDR